MRRIALLIASVPLVGAVACAGACAGPPRSADPSCPDPPGADLGSSEGWVGWIARHPDDVTFLLDDGRGGRIAHRADIPSPLASAGKVLHLAAYAKAVAQGGLRADEPVPLGEWDAWQLPGTDGGAHRKALEHLGIPHDGSRAQDPERTVPLDEIARVMIRFSDNAAPDLLRAKLGDEALLAAAREAGWANADLPTYLGQSLALLAPELMPPPEAERGVRAAAEWALARRFVAEPALRADLGNRALPDYDAQQRWADRTSAASASQLTALHRAIGTGSFGPGTELARRHLEWKPPPAGAAGFGFKNGSLPGVLTEAMTLRRTDGTVGTATLLVRHMSQSEWTEALDSFAHQPLLRGALDDPALAASLRCVA